MTHPTPEASRSNRLAGLMPCLLLLLALFLPQAAFAGIDIAADEIIQQPSGMIIARGNVEIRRENEVLRADEVTYDAANNRFEVKGSIRITSPRGELLADSASLDAKKVSGSLTGVKLTLPGGERVFADKAIRHEDGHYEIEGLHFSACPAEDESWAVEASRAVLDQTAGILTAEGASFRIHGFPIFYTPYWREPLRRQTGFLTPGIGSGKRRGTEVSLPFYFAPAESWDATLTPHWMSARGVMGEIEFRHLSGSGSELINFEGIRDKQTDASRGRIHGTIRHRIGSGMRLLIDADHISDRDYLADYAGGGEISARYLQSSADISRKTTLSDFSLSASDFQDLTLPTDATTLKIVPRFESAWATPIGSSLILHIDQQTTRFSRSLGVDGIRLAISPYLTIPWQAYDGAISATLHIGVRHHRYWLRDQIGAAMPNATGFEASMESRIVFERISSDGEWRHTIEPTLRYDLATAPDQSTLPDFDSGIGYLSMSNLLSGNRFSGSDRFERANRVSLLLQSRLQAKDESSQRTLLRLGIGASYNIWRKGIDPVLQPTVIRPVSNLLGELVWMPLRAIEISGGGQYDPSNHYWATSHANITWQNREHKLGLAYIQTDARYAQAADRLIANGDIRLASRWRLMGQGNYNIALKHLQYAKLGLGYEHPCWNLTVEAYRNSRITVLAGRADYGFRFLLGFKGVGSVSPS